MRSLASRLALGSFSVVALVAACGVDTEGESTPTVDGGTSASSSSGGSTSSTSSSSSSSSGTSGVVDGGNDAADGASGDAGIDATPGPACTTDNDCKGGFCNTAKKCVAGQSCRGSANGPAGIETCGAGEVGAPGAAHESCCKSLPLPVTTTRQLDKYEITAGRVRAFIDAVSAANAGVPDVRAWAKAYAAANPTSQLGTVESGYPGLIDAVLPDHAGPNGATPLPVHLGAFPMDPMNSLDGCFTSPGSQGHATYWQDPADVAVFGVGTAGVRKYGREILDTKAMNCVMPLMLATFCAWDGGELARTADFREVWGKRPVVLGNATVYVPWAAILPISQFNWRNGHGANCPNFPWPGCVNTPPAFYTYPADYVTLDDDTPVTSAPGRFVADVTANVSANGEGWHDVGGNMMDMAWPSMAVNPGASQIRNFCDTTSTPAAGDTACTRQGKQGVERFTGNLPHVALVGYSFEGHNRRSEAYLAGNNANIAAGDLKPVTFQYGKVGGRCARNVVP